MSEPKIWSKFEVKLHDGTIKKLVIQTLPTSMTEKVMKLIKEDFLFDTTISAAALAYSMDNLELSLKFYSGLITQGRSIVCVEDNDEPIENKEIVGVNLLVVSKKDDELPNFGDPESPLVKVMKIKYYQQIMVYDKYNVDEYLGAWGLTINRKYRRLGIGEAMIAAREKICKELGVRVTETLFTGVGAQKIAKKLNYELVFEMKYSELTKLTNLQFDKKDDKYMIMAKVYD